MRMTACLVLSLVVGWLVAAEAAVAQEPEPGSVSARHGLGWDGFLPDASLREEERWTLDSFVQGFNEEVTEIRRLIVVERSFRTSEERLEILRIKASFVDGFPEQRSLLTRIATLRIDLFIRTRRYDQAERATQEILPRGVSQLRSLKGYNLVRAPKGLVALENEILRGEQVGALRDRLAELRKRGPDAGDSTSAAAEVDDQTFLEQNFGTSTESMGQFVTQCLNREDLESLWSLGLRATSALAKLVLRDLAGELRYQHDPLFALIVLDAPAAARLVRQSLDRGGLDWKLRVLSAMDDSKVLWRRERSWKGENASPPATHPEWQEVLTWFIRQPTTSERAIALVNSVIFWNGLTPEVVEALLEHVEEGDTRRAMAVLKALTCGYPVPTARPIWEAAVEHSNAAVRDRAASGLLAYQWSEALLHQAGDESAAVRRSVARMLGMRRQHSISVPSSSSGHSDTSWKPQSLDARATNVLRALVRDADAGVREEAMRSVAALVEPLDRDFYLARLRDESDGVRSSLTQCEHLPLDLQVELLLALADDTSAPVLDALDLVVANEERWPEFLSSWPVMKKRLESNAYPFGTGSLFFESQGDRVEFCAFRIAKSEDGTVALLGWALDRHDDVFIEVGLRQIMSFGISYNQKRDGREDLLWRLDADQLATLFVWAHSFAPEQSLKYLVTLPFGEAPKVGQEALMLVFGQGAVDRTVRLLAATRAVRANLEGIGPAVLEFLREDCWRNEAPTSMELSVLAGGFDFPPEHYNQFVLTLLTDPRVVEPIQLACASNLRGPGPATDEVVDLILERWFDESGEPRTAVKGAIELLARLDLTPKRREFVERAFRSAAYVGSAVRVATEQNLPEFLPLLGGLVAGTGAPVEWGEFNRGDVLSRAVAALVAYGSREAAQYLVQGLLTSTGSLYEDVKSGLQKIKAAEEAGEFWADVRVVQDVEQELLGMLAHDNPVVRAEAARSLATVGSKEALPRLILLLEDDSDLVRKASRMALDRLHAGASEVEEDH